MSTCVTGTVNS